MTERVRQLRGQVRDHQRGRAARSVRYPEGLRREIVDVLGEAHRRGVAVARLAREIGVPTSTLTLWRRRARRGPFRRVAVTVPAPVIVSAPLVVVTPTGLRVEGLDLAGVITMLRALA